MNLEEMDGFFAALICGPEFVPPSEYVPNVWGKRPSNEGCFQSLEEAIASGGVGRVRHS
jgi:uncharacterized protein